MLAMRFRLMIFAAITVGALLIISFWPAAWLRYQSFGMPIDLGLTWWAPSLLLLIPVSLSWASAAAKNSLGRGIGLSIAAVLFCLFLLVMWQLNGLVQPFCGLWQGCISNWNLQG